MEMDKIRDLTFQCNFYCVSNYTPLLPFPYPQFNVNAGFGEVTLELGMEGRQHCQQCLRGIQFKDSEL